MKSLILDTIDGFRNERLTTNVRWTEKPAPKPLPRVNIDDSGYSYKHEGFRYFGKKGEELFLRSFVYVAFIIIVMMLFI